jgi:hypothetical protein
LVALSEEVLAMLEQLSNDADPAPWTSIVEGRDQEAGDSFIQVGKGRDRGKDIYVSRDTGPAGPMARSG